MDMFQREVTPLLCAVRGAILFLFYFFFLNINLGTFLSDLHFFFPSSFCVLWDFFFGLSLGVLAQKGSCLKHT